MNSTDCDRAADPPAVGLEVPPPSTASPAQWLLLVAACWLTWRPTETFPLSAIVAAGLILALAVWGWRRTSRSAAGTYWGLAGLGLLMTVSGVTGWDPAAAFPQLFLMAAVAVLIWLASRDQPPERWAAILAFGISLLTLWGIRQVVAGPEHINEVLVQVPEGMRAAAAERLASGRAFASQLLPSHLAVLLATALPLLLARVQFRWRKAVWILGSTLCVLGLALTRSPVGTGLALVACVAYSGAKKKGSLRLVVLALIVVLLLVVMMRADVAKLEPVSLRFDNWKSALWVWSTAPVTGVGTGGFAQAAQAVPFAMGNHPRHAHSLPLEWLAEFGPLGFLGIAWAGLLLWRLICDLWPRRPDLAVAVGVIPAHNLIDFSLYGSGVAIPWAVLVGWAIAARGRGEAVEPEPRGRAVIVTAVAVAAAATMLHVTSRLVGEVAALHPDTNQRLESALESRRLAPWRVRPLALVANAAVESGDPILIRTAQSELRRAEWLRPRSAALAGLRSRVDEALGDAPSAVSEAWVCGRERPLGKQELLRSVLTRVPKTDGHESR